MAVICVFFSKKKASKNHSLTRESSLETQHESCQKRCTWLYSVLYLASMQQIKRKYQENVHSDMCEIYDNGRIECGITSLSITHGNALDKKVFLSGISIPQKQDINQQLLTGTDRAGNYSAYKINSVSNHQSLLHKEHFRVQCNQTAYFSSSGRRFKTYGQELI